jgi:AcrR family transcriptional regulator
MAGIGRSKPSRDQRRAAILDVAREVFLERGFAAASMSVIAARLGGSKGTLYNYFKNKEDLFEAHVEDYCGRQAESIFAFPMEGADTRLVLTDVGERFLHLILSNEGTRFFSLIVAEAQRYPQVGRAFFNGGPATSIRRLGEYLERARADGQIVVEDCFEAAEEFLGLCQAGLHLRRIVNVVPEPTDAEIRAQAVRAVKLFMKAYGAK